MPRFRHPGAEGDSFEGELFQQGKRPGIPVRGEIEGEPKTLKVRGCFGLTAGLSRTLQVPSSNWYLHIGPTEQRCLRLTNFSSNQAGPIVVFEGELEIP
jgi:hypothetical protein